VCGEGGGGPVVSGGNDEMSAQDRHRLLPTVPHRSTSDNVALMDAAAKTNIPWHNSAVASTVAPSPLALRRLGAQIRGLREKARKTHEDVQLAGIAGRTKMWRIESGQVPVKPGDIWALCHLYNAPTERVQELVALAWAARQGPYWEDYDRVALPDWFGIYADLERAASAIAAWEPMFVAGLLQTQEYMQALMEADDQLDARAVQDRVRFRRTRQKVLERADRPQITVVQGAGSLILQVGSPEVMAGQVAHLRDLHVRGLAEVLVLPATAGAHAVPSSGFTILDFPHQDDPAAVYTEIPLGAHYYETPEQVGEIRRAYGQLRRHSITIEEYTS
jgi:hypothetical protein